MTNHKNKWMWSLWINCVVFLCRWWCLTLAMAVCVCAVCICVTSWIAIVIHTQIPRKSCTFQHVPRTNACMRYNKYITNMISVLIFHSFAQNDNNTRRLLMLILFGLKFHSAMLRLYPIVVFLQDQVANDVVRIHNVNANLDNGRQWCVCACVCAYIQRCLV